MLGAFFHTTFHFLLGLFVILMGGAACWGAIQRLRQTVLVPKFHPRRIGRMVATGLVRAVNSKDVHFAPLSLTPCIAYQFLILERRSKNSVVVLYRESKGQWNLKLQTQMGMVQLNPRELDLDKIHDRDNQHLFESFSKPRSVLLLEEKGIKPTNITRMRRSLTLKECILSNGDSIRVIGRREDDHQPLLLEDAIITNKSVLRVILESFLMLIVGAAFIWFALGLIDYAFR